jgi:hypothetical protein
VPSPLGKDILSGSMYTREARPHRTKGGYYVVDDLCNTCGALDVGTNQRLHDWWIHSYFACHRNRCCIDQGHSGAKTCMNDFIV